MAKERRLHDRLERVQAAVDQQCPSTVACSHRLYFPLLSGYWLVTAVAAAIATVLRHGCRHSASLSAACPVPPRQEPLALKRRQAARLNLFKKRDHHEQDGW